MNFAVHPDKVIYLDHNATTPVHPDVLEAMLPYLREYYGNPSSAYRFGSQIRRAIDNARQQVAALIGCEPREILFTGCGTESNNATLASALLADRDRQQIVTTSVEHSAIVKHADTLARRGHPVTLLPVNSPGQLDLDAVRAALSEETALLSVMWANNETGTIFPVKELAEIAAEKGVPFHTDAVQAAGKIPLRVSDLPVRFLSLSGHKLQCPKGIGALFVSARARFHPYFIGGGQEGGRRGGTENVAGIVAFGKAAEIALAHLEAHAAHVQALRDTFEQTLLSALPDGAVNGDPSSRLPNTSSLRFEGADAEAVLVLLDKEGVCASAGSACTTGSLNPSHVLTAMGLTTDQARSTLRFSFGPSNTPEEVRLAADIVAAAVTRVRSLRAPGPVAIHTQADR